jgi:hypothetical protein
MKESPEGQTHFDPNEEAYERGFIAGAEATGVQAEELMAEFEAKYLARLEEELMVELPKRIDIDADPDKAVWALRGQGTNFAVKKAIALFKELSKEK